MIHHEGTKGTKPHTPRLKWVAGVASCNFVPFVPSW
jgi:hypothetical protein